MTGTFWYFVAFFLLIFLGLALLQCYEQSLDLDRARKIIKQQEEEIKRLRDSAFTAPQSEPSRIRQLYLYDLKDN
jgi:hypothetical protein